MPYCSRCGKLNDDDSKFCVYCGTPTSPASASAGGFGERVGGDAQDFARSMKEEAERVAEKVRREAEWRTGRAPPEVNRNEALLGAISAGAVLIIFAGTVLSYPNSLTALIDYIRRMAELGGFIRPPRLLLDAASFFFVAIGLWALGLAVLRLVLQRSMRKSLGDIVGALFSFYLAYVIASYAAVRIGGVAASAFVVIGLGMVIIADGLIAVALPWPRPSAG
ncbi:MAG: zinc ribbon domain-containing protein [Conexivisphaerales archaeon]|jgi:hypothetical protein